MEKQAKHMERFQQSWQNEVVRQPPKSSCELIEWRKRQFFWVKLKNYSEAREMKVISDAFEEEELGTVKATNPGSLAKR
jgi:hypothetical protein